MDSVALLINEMFNALSNIEKAAEGWLSVGKTVACLGAYIYIFKKFGTKIISGEVFNVTDIAYPFFIAILLSVYTPVAKGIHEIFTLAYDETAVSADIGMIQSTLSSKSANEEEKIDQSEDNAVLAPDHDEANRAWEFIGGDEVSSEKEKMNWLDRQSQKVIDGINSVIIKVFLWLIDIIAVIAMAILFLLARTYILFLYIFGPFSIGMSLIPGFENSITNWFQKYISYCLWFPIGGTMVSFVKEISVNVLGSTAGGAPVSSFATTGMFIVAAAMMVILFLSVPKIASNILAVSAGSSGTAKTIKSASRMIATKGMAK